MIAMLKLRTPLARKGYHLYQEVLKPQLEPGHLGEYVAIEVESGDYFLGTSLDEALESAEHKYPDREFFIVKVGELVTASFKHHYTL